MAKLSEVTFTKIVVQGGGTLVIDSSLEGMTLRGSILHVESGGMVEVDKVEMKLDYLLVDDSAVIQADYKVSLEFHFTPYFLFWCSSYVA